MGEDNAIRNTQYAIHSLDSNKNHRVFTGIQLPESTAQLIERKVKNYNPFKDAIRLVKFKTIHFTLHFFSSLSVERIRWLTPMTRSIVALKEKPFLFCSLDGRSTVGCVFFLWFKHFLLFYGFFQAQNRHLWSESPLREYRSITVRGRLVVNIIYHWCRMEVFVWHANCESI